MTTLKDLAEEIKMDRSALRKAVLKMGIAPRKMRTMASLGQATLALTDEDAAKVRAHYSWRTDTGVTDGIIFRTIPTKHGLDAKWYDALVIHTGMPESIASYLRYYSMVGLDSMVQKGGAWENLAKREATEIADWIEKTVAIDGEADDR